MVTGTGGVPMGGSPGKNQPMGESEDNLGDNMNDLGLEDDGMDDIGASDLPDAGMPGDEGMDAGMPGGEAGMDAGMPGDEGMGDDLGMGGGDKGTCSLSKLREVLEAEYPEIAIDELMSKVQDTGAESGAGDLDALGGGDDMGMGGDDMGMGDDMGGDGMGGDELAGAPADDVPGDDMEKMGECMEGVGGLNESYTPDESRARFGRRALVSTQDISKVAALVTDDPDVFN